MSWKAAQQCAASNKRQQQSFNMLMLVELDSSSRCEGISTATQLSGATAGRVTCVTPAGTTSMKAPEQNGSG